jgi:hypothetical protein
MRPRTELAIAVGAVLVLGIVVVALGGRGARPGDEDLRRSTYLAGPLGARGYAEAVQRLGITVVRHRARTRDLAGRSDLGDGTAYAVLDPVAPLSPLDAVELSRLAGSGASLLLAGRGAEAAMLCYGYARRMSPRASASFDGEALQVNAVLYRLPDSLARRRTLLDDGSDVGCGPIPAATDVLLATDDGSPVAIRLTPESGGPVTLVADGHLFSNRALRETAAGEFTLGLVAGRSSRLVVDEYHQGFGAGGGMLPALGRWLRESPWGWATIHLFIVALLALLVAAVRFGPQRQVILRRRRSPLEHVRALANALAAARGHDEAIALLVRGLRRRLARPGEQLRGDVRPWLSSLAGRVSAPGARAAVATLESLTRGGADAVGVRRAALAVEDLWQDLKP